MIENHDYTGYFVGKTGYASYMTNLESTTASYCINVRFTLKINLP